MSFHAAGQAEADEIAYFLRGHLARAMFPLSNLVHRGEVRAGTGRLQ